MERRATRARLGLADTHVVFGVFGALTAEKRIAQILRAFARTRRYTPEARLVLAGKPDAALDIPAQVRQLNLSEAVLMLGMLDDKAFEQTIASVDVCISLRWPTALETSGPWIQALSAGRPTIITDLEQLSHVPALDPRNWPAGQTTGNVAVSVAVDILDEDHSLTLAMRRLATDKDLRVSLGRSGRAFWEREHSEARMLNDYRRVMVEAASLPIPALVLPPHLRPDPMAHMRDVLADFPEVTCELR
jgi:glycosyltransferase involved in cell wall biosynthesis